MILSLFDTVVQSLSIVAGAAGHQGYVLPLQLFTLLAIFLFIRFFFGLSASCAMAPLGVLLGVGIVVLAFMMIVVRPYLLEAYTVSTIAMAPTVPAGSRFVTCRLLHPRRLDLVTYREPQSGEIYIKRLIGLPDDQIRFDGGDIFVNNQKLAPPPVLAGRCHAKAGPVESGLYADGQTITLGPDEVFVIGDNVERSYDSRMDGPSRSSAVTGVVDLIYWPPSCASLPR